MEAEKIPPELQYKPGEGVKAGFRLFFYNSKGEFLKADWLNSHNYQPEFMKDEIYKKHPNDIIVVMGTAWNCMEKDYKDLNFIVFPESVGIMLDTLGDLL